MYTKGNLDEIYRKYAGEVYKYLMCLTRNPDLSEELLQETFYQATKTIDKFRGDCKITVWLCQIAKRAWYKELEKKHQSVPIEEIQDAVSSEENIEDNYLQHIEAVELYKKLHNLEAKTREVMYLRLSNVLSFKEIGEILGESETWARVTFYRGKEKLRQEENKKGNVNRYE